MPEQKEFVPYFERGPVDEHGEPTSQKRPITGGRDYVGELEENLQDAKITDYVGDLEKTLREEGENTSREMKQETEEALTRLGKARGEMVEASEEEEDYVGNLNASLEKTSERKME